MREPTVHLTDEQKYAAEQFLKARLAFVANPTTENFEWNNVRYADMWEVAKGDSRITREMLKYIQLYRP